MEVSLIISTFNRKHFLLPLLHKLEYQSFKDFEVIVANDGSTDGTVGEVEKLINSLSFELSIVSQENKGYRLAKSRNNAARAAKAKQLVFMDDDCRPDDIFLESYQSCFSDNHLLRGDIIFVSAFEKMDEILFVHSGGPLTALWGANFSISSGLFWEIGGYNEEFINQFGEDGDLQLRLWDRGIDTLPVKGAHVYHLGRPNAGGNWF